MVLVLLFLFSLLLILLQALILLLWAFWLALLDSMSAQLSVWTVGLVSKLIDDKWICWKVDWLTH